MNPVLSNLAPALPEIFVFSMACVILLADLFLSEKRRFVSCGLALIAMAGAALLTLANFGAAGLAFNGMFVADALADTLKLAIYFIVFFVLIYSRDYLHSRAMYKGEYFVLALFGVTGMMIMASAAHFLTLYLGLELLSLSLYAMVAFQRDSVPATEAAMKYFVLGALASGMLLYGMSMLYGATGSLEIGAVRKAIGAMSPDNMILIFGLVFVIVGLGFQLGAVPFHMWAPDVYEGARADEPDGGAPRHGQRLRQAEPVTASSASETFSNECANSARIFFFESRPERAASMPAPRAWNAARIDISASWQWPLLAQ
jgi:NADH-quinone oxidoreductase subunit N